MNELLEKLLASDVLNAETKQQLSEEFTKQITTAIEEAKTAARADVTAELHEQWITEREQLIEAIDRNVSPLLEAELAQLRNDVERYRDADARNAAELVEAKAAMAEQVKSDIGDLSANLDTFIEARLSAELSEFRESIEEVKRIRFGQRIMEAFADEYGQFLAPANTSEAKLAESETRLAESQSALAQANDRVAALERSIKMEQVLAPLSGRAREIMEAVLKSVDTSRIDEAYSVYVGRVLKESSVVEEKTSKQEAPVLNEGATKNVPAGKVVTGDNKSDQQTITESHSAMSEEARRRMRHLAGLE